MNLINLFLLWGWKLPITLANLNNSTVVGDTRCPGYKLDQVKVSNTSLVGRLTLAGEPCNKYGKDINELKLKVDYERTRVRVTIDEAERTSFRVPENLLFPDTQHQSPGSSSDLIEFKYEENPFSFQVTRKDSHEILFDTKQHPLIFEEGYLHLASSLPKDANIYGIGEVVGSFRRDPDNTVQAMWARDAASPTEENVYGDHPLYIEIRDGLAHGVHILNSYGMDVTLANQSVSYDVLGGALDLSFFAGPTPRQVNDHYTATFGRPQLIPYWALGFHQCRWGYKTIDDVEEVVKNYELAKLPLETMWSDIDYMDMYKDFTVDPIKYPLDRVQNFVTKLHENHQRYVVIIDPAISRNETYPPYLDGKIKDVFIKNPDGSDYVGQVWPGYTLFPDWFAPNTQAWWTEHISEFMAKVPVDGLWIDMNEPASFCAGSCGSNRTGIPPQPWLDDSYQADLPQLFKEPNYAIHNHYGNLSIKTVSTDAVHHGGITELQVHNLYGHMEAVATRNALESIQPNRRPFILSRSTFTGSGAVTAHWLGDNHSTWDHLVKSIAGVLSFQMYGIPFVGSDICGFIGNTTEELCLRWMQLGAMYPFSRNHNNFNERAQEPYLWSSVTEASRRALHTRYQLLPYYYTLLHHAHRDGTSVWNPLGFEFLDQPELLKIDRQFLVGRGLLASPVLTPNVTTVDATFPSGTWYDYHTYQPIVGPTTVTLSAPLDGHSPLHLRSGFILPLQDPHSHLTLTPIQLEPYQLIVTLDPNSHLTASGDLYLDDGLTPHHSYHDHSNIQFVATSHNLTSHGQFHYLLPNLPSIDTVTILGIAPPPSSSISVTLTNTTTTTTPITPSQIQPLPLHSGAPVGFRLTNLNLPLDQPFILNF